ncbi:methyltransferase [Actinorhabdospora filicis]|uniref:Methyltransferase n=1 Tax=Actinorhabdospora filicis TaxID=1785913 RepID=A0A9W6SHV1_9ACTN|nr:class I SAM-dependent methyltransferase [Actinorhabdospora filicis]GLZ76260.1 methyltransferase [Actinorhabdospora filicis]
MTFGGTPDWTPFISATTDQAPRPIHLDAVARFAAPGRAVDLGFGAGNESLDLLDRGWTVTAVDSSPAAVETLRRRAAGRDDRLTVVQSDLADAEIGEADYVFAGFSLFFTAPERFPDMWKRVRAAVAPGGRIAAHFLGDRDTWSGDDGITAVTEDEARALLDGLVLEHWHVTDEDGRAFSGPKHWHVFGFIAHRPA